jgi:uncharacterized Zn-finger protein
MELFCRLKKIINFIEVTENDLPLACPTNASFRHLHPRIYLPVKQAEMVTCPYCNTKYKFTSKGIDTIVVER